MRLGSWPMEVSPDALLARLYGGAGTYRERHRHRYEVHPEYVDRLQDAGLVIGGGTPGMEGRRAGLVEAIELPGHPFFLGLQSPPECRSRLMAPRPPLLGRLEAAVTRRKKTRTVG